MQENLIRIWKALVKDKKPSLYDIKWLWKFTAKIKLHNHALFQNVSVVLDEKTANY